MLENNLKKSFYFCLFFFLSEIKIKLKRNPIFKVIPTMAVLIKVHET